MAARNVIYRTAGSETETIDGLLKDDYVIQQIQDTVNKSTLMLSKIKSEKTTAGRQFIFPVQLGVSQGVGARLENTTLPSAGFGEYDQASGNVKYIYGSFYITGQAISATKGNKAAFADALKQALRDTREGLKLDVQRQIWGDGTGAIAKVDGAVSASATVPVKDPYNLSYDAADALTGSQKTRLFKRNMNLYFDSGTDQQGVVSAVNSSAGTLTLTATTTLDDNAVIYRGDTTSLHSKDKEIAGISKFMTATGTYLNISRTGTPEWQANVVDLSDAISEDAIRSALNTALINGVAEPDLIVTDLVTKARYEKLLQAQKRFVNPMELEGGFKVLEFDGMPIWADKDAPPQRMYFFHMPDIVWFVMEDYQFMDRDGAVLSRVANKDAYEAVLFSYRDLACKRPANQTVLHDITG